MNGWDINNAKAINFCQNRGISCYSCAQPIFGNFNLSKIVRNGNSKKNTMVYAICEQCQHSGEVPKAPESPPNLSCSDNIRNRLQISSVDYENSKREKILLGNRIQEIKQIIEDFKIIKESLESQVTLINSEITARKEQMQIKKKSIIQIKKENSDIAEELNQFKLERETLKKNLIRENFKLEEEAKENLSKITIQVSQQTKLLFELNDKKNTLIQDLQSSLVGMRGIIEEQNEIKNIICTICMENTSNHSSKNCGHIFCEQCINQLETCPTCDVGIDKMKLFF